MTHTGRIPWWTALSARSPSSRSTESSPASTCDANGTDLRRRPSANPTRNPSPRSRTSYRRTSTGAERSSTCPWSLAGTPFQQRVWAALRDIPYGETITYGQLADRIGQPTAARAVGLANGKNPIGIIVPCHRVVGSTGRLTGYGGGLATKQHLLSFERGATEASLF